MLLNVFVRGRRGALSQQALSQQGKYKCGLPHTPTSVVVVQALGVGYLFQESEKFAQEMFEK